MLLLMVVEGPIITYIASFAAASGIFNIYIVFLLSVIGNTVPDKIFYFIGKFLRGDTVERFLAYFGMHKKLIKSLENQLEKHLGKAIISAKLTPILPVPAMLLAGFMKVDFRKFFIISTLFDIIASIVFVMAGYYMGWATDITLKYLRLEVIFVPILILAAILFYYLSKFAYLKVAMRFRR